MSLISMILYEAVILYTPAPLLQELGLKNKIHTRESRNMEHTEYGTHGQPEHGTHGIWNTRNMELTEHGTH